MTTLWFLFFIVPRGLPESYGPVQSLEQCRALARQVKKAAEENNSAFSAIEIKLDSPWVRCVSTNGEEASAQ